MQINGLPNIGSKSKILWLYNLFQTYFKLPFLLLTDIYFYLYTSILLFIYLLTDIKIEINEQTLNKEGEREVLPLSKYSIPLPHLFQTSISSSPSLSRSWILKYIQDIPKKKKTPFFKPKQTIKLYQNLALIASNSSHSFMPIVYIGID